MTSPLAPRPYPPPRTHLHPHFGPFAAGFFCPKATSKPIRCRAGTYCPRESAAETPCQAGTYNRQTVWVMFNGKQFQSGGTSEADCFDCPKVRPLPTQDTNQSIITPDISCSTHRKYSWSGSLLRGGVQRPEAMSEGHLRQRTELGRVYRLRGWQFPRGLGPDGMLALLARRLEP